MLSCSLRGQFDHLRVVSPAYFVVHPLGIRFQTASAFNQVQSAFSFFVRAYTTLAEYRAVIQRLIGFEQAIVAANDLQAESALQCKQRADQSLTMDDVLLWLPNKKPVVAADKISIPGGVSVLLMGPTGSGKSTLFRAIAGIWPFGTGTIGLPHDAKLFVLPQRPYLPVGPLRRLRVLVFVQQDAAPFVHAGDEVVIRVDEQPDLCIAAPVNRCAQALCKASSGG